MVSRIKKYGFTLVEALVVLLIISVFFAATTKVITQKRKNNKIVYQHGQYECWKDGSSHKYKYIIDGVSGDENTGEECKFKPTLNAALYDVYIVYSDGYYIESLKNINNELKIKLSTDDITISRSDSSSASIKYMTSDITCASQEDEDEEDCYDKNNLGSRDSLNYILEYRYKESIFNGEDNTTGLMIFW